MRSIIDPSAIRKVANLYWLQFRCRLYPTTPIPPPVIDFPYVLKLHAFGAGDPEKLDAGCHELGRLRALCANPELHIHTKIG